MSLLQDNDAARPQDIELGRRRLLTGLAVGGGAAVGSALIGAAAKAAPSAKEIAAAENVERATRGMPVPRIKDISVLQVGLGGLANYSVVKVTTDQPGLYGYGDATLEARAQLVRIMVEQYLKPLLVGKDVDRIEQLWQLCYLSSYYKNDQAQNSAISGVTDALWDIKGRMAGMPVYQLVGGKARDACEAYAHPGLGKGDPATGLVEESKKLAAQGFRNLLVSVFQRDATVKGLDGAESFDRDLEIRKLMKAFEAFRREMPADIKLGCDMHSMFDGPRAVQFCKDAEQFKPILYMEDPVPPEEEDHMRVIRQSCATPLAIGELWNNPHEWRPLIQDRVIDYFRIHITHIGGFTPARRVAAFAENFEARSSYHGSSVSPLGHMANLTVEITSNNSFGVHEYIPYPAKVGDFFRGSREVKDGYAWISEKPGWGVEVDEAAVAKLPAMVERGRTQRLPDGTGIVGGG